MLLSEACVLYYAGNIDAKWLNFCCSDGILHIFREKVIDCSSYMLSEIEMRQQAHKNVKGNVALHLSSDEHAC